MCKGVGLCCCVLQGKERKFGEGRGGGGLALTEGPG